MGTPEFAVPSLQKLYESGYTIAGVVTAPDKPAGRGMQLTQSAVKKFALEKGLNILQPEKLKSPEFLQELQSLNADIQVVVAFRMLPEVVWNMPPLGTINLHASLLPNYRGAAPINWAIINGEKETGLTTFRLTHTIDTGDILLQKKLKISDEENAGNLHDRMMEEGSGLLVETLQKIESQSIRPISQNEIQQNEIKPAPKIFTETAHIDWNNSSEKIQNLIRGLSPYPGAFTFLAGKKLKIFKSESENKLHQIKPGEIESDHKTYLKFATSNGFISVHELQLEGKKRMLITDFLRGYRL